MRRFKDAFKGGRLYRPVSDVSPGQSDGDGVLAPQPPLTPDEALPSQPSQSTGNIATFPDGVKVWHTCPDACVDICFVHGLTGNRDSTWTAQGQSTAWPKALLPSKLPQACLLTYGYDAYVVQASTASINRLLDHAANFLNDLINDRARRGALSRPLILVAHSLGGLVRKKAILLSRFHPEPHLHNVFDHIIGVAFMGTPHKGSWMAKWAKIPAGALSLVKSSNKSLLAVLETDDQLLESIQNDFLSMVREMRENHRRLDVTCFFEELALPVAGYVVTKESATLDGYTAVSIHANHRDMVRFSFDDDTGFQRILGELIRWSTPVMPASDDQRKGKAPQLVTKDAHPMMRQEGKSYYYIPFPRNKRFVGRGPTLERLQEMLFVQDYQKVALVGLGGVGKTQVALQLAYWVKEHRPEYSIFWIPVLSHATFEEAYVEMARRLPIQRRDDNDDIKDLVQQYLSSADAGPWLLVVDNADNGDVLFTSHGLSNYLPESELGLTLFTTRSRDVAVETAASGLIDLSEMDSSEAMRFFESSLARKDLISDPTANELLNALTFLPLAISQAAAYINKNQISIAEYLWLLRSTEENMTSLLSREFRDNTRYSGSHNTVAATWLVSFEQIRKTDSAAAKLLSFISHIEPKAIPQSILPTADIEEHTVNAIGTLCGYAFLVRRGETNTFDMHSLVHFAIKVWQENLNSIDATEDDVMAHLTTVLQHISSTTDHYLALWRNHLPHALRVLFKNKDRQSDEKFDLFIIVGRCLYEDRRFKEAITCFEEACKWGEKCFHEWDNGRLYSEHDLARAYLRDHRGPEAITLLRHVVAIKQEKFSKDHSSRLTSEHELGRALFENDQWKESIDILERVVKIRQQQMNRTDQFSSEHVLAIAYGCDGQVSKAITMLKDVLSGRQKKFPEANKYRLSSEHELAWLYFKNEQKMEAAQLMEHVVTIQRATLPEDDTRRLRSEASLGVIYASIDQIKEGIKLLENVVAVHRRNNPEGSGRGLSSQIRLARAYNVDGQTAKAIEILEHAVGVDSKMLPDSNPTRLVALNTLADIHEDQGQLDKVIKLREMVVASQAQTLAEEDPGRLMSEKYLGASYKADGQVDKAMELLEHVVAVERRMLPDKVSRRLGPMENLAGLYPTKGQFEKEIELREEMVAIQRQTHTEEDPGRLVSEHNLATAYAANAQFDKAAELLELVVAVEARIMLEDDSARLTSQRALARVRWDASPYAWLEYAKDLFTETEADGDDDVLITSLN